MAEEVELARTGERGKVRHPLGILGLMLITFGIYYWVWYYKVNKEMATLGRARSTDAAGTSPGTSLVAVTLGAIVVVPALVSMYNSGKRLSVTEGLAGRRQGMEPGLLWLLLVLISPVGIYIFQSNLNQALEAQAELPSGETGASGGPTASHEPGA